MNDNARCGDCAFWIDRGQWGDGVCRRHAPRVRTDKDKNTIPKGEVRNKYEVTYWPTTKKLDFCGDFEPKKS